MIILIAWVICIASLLVIFDKIIILGGSEDE